MSECLKVIRTRAPLRLNDIGGWTDTWFSGEGRVLNMAVSPPVEVEIEVFGNEERNPERSCLHVLDYGESFMIDPDEPDFSTHPLLQAALNSIPVPKNLRLDISIHSPFPPGSAIGTSASVCVALLGALTTLHETPYTREQIVSLAHRAETEKLGLQSGIQDQVCAAYGGICDIRMPSYPEFEVEKIELLPDSDEELNDRLCLIYLGDAHSSSDLHRQVISVLEQKDAPFAQMQILRQLAAEAKDSLAKGEIIEFGCLMTKNNEAQRKLDPRLISPEADAVAAIARKHGAIGWKVNGAGGKGGSITILASREEAQKSAMFEQIDGLGRGIKNLPVCLSSQGLTVEKKVKSIGWV
jgi:D-glycero-alpha-D-manno-heptose-7-phosphate kinase